MSMVEFGSIPERLEQNRYETDKEQSHIEVDQAAIAAAGAGPMLVRICPAHVYSAQVDGTVGILYAACLECGTCRAVAPLGSLTWHYPPQRHGHHLSGRLVLAAEPEFRRGRLELMALPRFPTHPRGADR